MSFDFYAAYKVLLDHIRKDLPPGRTRDLAVERLEESAFWTGATIAGEPSPIDYVDRGYMSAKEAAAASKKPTRSS